jgi:hypothetical protein
MADVDATNYCDVAIVEKRDRGRPRRSKNKPKSSLATAASSSTLAKRRLGRPIGSKNKKSFVTMMDPVDRLNVSDEVYPRQCPCRRAFELENVLGTWRTRRRLDESRGTRGFTQVQPPRKVKGLRPACLTLY